MKTTVSQALIVTLFVLAGCSSATPEQSTLPQAQVPVSPGHGVDRPNSSGLTALYNLDYSTGTITVFSIQGNKAKVATQFTPGSASGGAQGLAADAQGNIYTTLTESGGSPCTACVQIYSNNGTLVTQLDAPTLSGSPGAPDLTDVSVDAHDNVYVSDFGQDAVYFFPHAKMTKNGPTIVVQNYHNAASVSAQPDGKNVFVSGGCGFASVAPFRRTGHGNYTQGNCFGIATIALIGGAADNQEEVMTPVDPEVAFVSISSPTGRGSIQVPDRSGSVSSVALNSNGSIAYVADAHNEKVYAFARPASGWISKSKPKLLATYKGFKALNIIAVPQ
jgi:hypothetical protein